MRAAIVLTILLVAPATSLAQSAPDLDTERPGDALAPTTSAPMRHDAGVAPTMIESTEHRRAERVLTAGAVVLGITYSITATLRTALCAQALCSSASGWLYAPGFGAIVYAATAPNALLVVAGAFDAIAQNVGALLLLAGTARRREHLSPNSTRAPVAWWIAPVGPAGSVGLSLAITTF